MSRIGRRRALLGAVVGGGAVLTLAAFVQAYRATIDVVGGARVDQLRALERLGGARFGECLEAVTDHLRQLGLRPANGGGIDLLRGFAAELRRSHARQVREVALVGLDGRVMWTEPDGRWPAGSVFPVEGLVESTAESQELTIRAGRSESRPEAALFAAMPFGDPARAPAGSASVLVATIDVAPVVREVTGTLADEASGVSAIADSRGQLVASVGGDGARPPTTLAELLPGPELETVRRDLTAGTRVVASVEVALAGHRQQATVVGEPVRVAEATWSIVTLLPRRAVLREARSLLLVGALLLFLAVATGAAALARFTQISRERGAVRAELERLRKQAEANDRDRRGRFLAEEGREPVVYLRDLKVVAANMAAVRALEVRDLADLHGRSFGDFLIEDERQRIERFLVGRVAGANVPEQFQARIVTSRQGHRLVEMVTSLVEREGNVLEHVSWRDVTSRERAEALLRTVATAVPTALVLCDDDGNFIWANGAFGRLVQQPADRFHGVSLLPVLVPADRRRARLMFARARRGLAAEGTLRVMTGANETVLTEVLATQVGVAGESFGVLFAGTDVTERVREAERREKSRRGEVLGALAAGVAHRLSNDFQALLGVMEKAGTEPGIEGVRADVVAIVESAAESLSRFVVASRVGTATMHPLRLGRIVERWVASAVERTPSSVRITSRVDTESDRIVGDSAQVGLFLDAALSAAISVLRSGGGAVEVAVEPSSSSGFVRLAVADTAREAGAGVVPDQEPGIVIAPRDLAAGVAEIVAQRHGGSWGSRQRPGIGTRLWIELPLRRGEAEAAAEVRHAPRSGAVLVADDEELVRASLAEALRANGMEAIEVGDGGAALHEVTSAPERFALVVLDLVMPVMDGREVLSHLRRSYPDLPVLICTGYDPSDDETLSAAEVLVKPFTVDEFLGKVKELLGSGAAGDTGDGTMTQ